MNPSPARFSALKYLDNLLFAGAVVGGALAITAVDAANASKWIAVIVCVALMGGYMAASLGLPGLRLRADQAADNLYYLGLLYTLTSLGVALIRFADSEQSTTSILRNFGIAIFTTIVGVGLRVFVGQFRDDPEDLEDEARVALSEGVRRMRAELDLSVAELRGFADAMRQVVADFTDQTARATATALEAATGRFAGATEGLADRLSASASGFDAKLAGFDAALAASVAALEALSTRLAAGARAVGDFVAASDRLNLAGQTMGAAADKMRAAASSAGEASQLVAQLDRAANSAMKATVEFSTRLSQVGAEAERRESRSVAAIHQAGADAAGMATEEARARLAQIEAAAAQVVVSLRSLDREFSGSSATIQTVRRELAELAAWIIERLKP